MQTFKDSVEGEVYQYEDDVDVSKLASAPTTLEPYTIPAQTQADLDAAALAAKWVTIAEFWSTLTVTISGNKYKADEAGANRMALKRDALAADKTSTWYEDWGSFETNKVDLQDAIAKADAELQTFIDATMGTV